MIIPHCHIHALHSAADVVCLLEPVQGDVEFMGRTEECRNEEFGAMEELGVDRGNEGL